MITFEYDLPAERIRTHEAMRSLEDGDVIRLRKERTHVTWRTPDHRWMTARPGDNPDDPQALLFLEQRDEERGAFVTLYGRPNADPEAPVEKHVVRLVA